MKAFESFRRIMRGVDTVMAMITGIILGADLVFITLGVILRPIGLGLALFEEFPRLWQGFLTFLMIAAALKAREHINVDLVLSNLKGPALVCLQIFIFGITGFASIYLMLSSLDAMLALRGFGEMSISEAVFPVWYLYLPQVLGFILLFIASVELVIDASYVLVAKKGYREEKPKVTVL